MYEVQSLAAALPALRAKIRQWMREAAPITDWRTSLLRDAIGERLRAPKSNTSRLPASKRKAIHERPWGAW